MAVPQAFSKKSCPSFLELALLAVLLFSSLERFPSSFLSVLPDNQDFTMAHHHPHKPKRLSLLQSPLIPQEKRSPQIQLQPVSEYFGSEAAYSPAATNEDYSDVTNVQPEGPQFQRHEEATTIELFYDLFFVANLTTFTSLHKINDGKSLRSYAGFFSILWFTWCQVSLFDVRFVSDGLLERTAKACRKLVKQCPLSLNLLTNEYQRVWSYDWFSSRRT